MTEQTSHPHPRPYGLIFLGLFILTMVELFVANLHLPKVAIVLVLVSLALVKAAMVAMFYMHLRFEKVLLSVIAFSPLILSLIMVLMVSWDVAHLHLW